MREALICHPQTPCGAVRHIHATARRDHENQISLAYDVTGAIAELEVPARQDAGRADDLWQHMCFEFFFRLPGGPEYCEVNVSPSGQWAFYGFSDYRAGMQNVTGVTLPTVDTNIAADRVTLKTALTLDTFPAIKGHAPLTIGLSAVIEETNGNKSYWALAHPPGKPDFHHADCFVRQLVVSGAS